MALIADGSAEWCRRQGRRRGEGVARTAALLAVLLVLAAGGAVRGSVDLRITSVRHTVPLPGPVVDEAIPIAVTIVNDGDVPSLPFAVDLWQNRRDAPTSGTGSDQRQYVNSLPPGENRAQVLVFTVHYDRAGTWPLYVLADGDLATADPDRGNNVFGIFVTTAPPAVDLIVHEVTASTDRLIAGRPFLLSVTVKNLGRIDAGPSAVAVYGDRKTAPAVGDAADQVVAVPPVPAGQDVTVELEMSYPAAGDYTLWTFVDPQDVVPEFDEGNNTTRIPVRITGGGCLAGATRDVFPLLLLPVFLTFVAGRRIRRLR